ncbi:hypothetical protein ECC02_000818 [Trypanosoma cruzi]|uniref:Uncharacterized protein n=1 Tax=Trypanosoma cruzi TaxID=5693 RepID=A0A7J6YHK5_TRYCR|nr:hypothetical protein ECC02_000818 [Trypanosoma cruzi]
MHTHAGPLVLSFARHAPLPSCLAAWAEHRNCFCFVFIALSGRPLSLSPCVCVLLYGSNESACAGRPTIRLFVFCCFTCVVVWCAHYIFFYRLLVCFDCGRMIFILFFCILLRYFQCFLFLSSHEVSSFTYSMCQLVHVTPRSAVLLVLLVVMMFVMCCASGCFAASLAYSCSSDKAMRADRAKSIAAVVRDVPFGSEGAAPPHREDIASLDWMKLQVFPHGLPEA